MDKCASVKNNDSSSGLSLRPVTEDDIDLLYQWANDPVVRANAFSTDFIPYENHVKWFNNALSRKDVIIYILIADGKPVGQVRLNEEDEGWEIDYSIDSSCRGKGYGNLIISLLEKEIEKNPAITKMIAQVKETNIPSNKAFMRNSFAIKDKRGGVVTYYKSIRCE